MHVNREAIATILEEAGIKPDTVVHTDNGDNTAENVLEAAIMGALDEIEENQEDTQ